MSSADQMELSSRLVSVSQSDRGDVMWSDILILETLVLSGMIGARNSLTVVVNWCP